MARRGGRLASPGSLAVGLLLVACDPGPTTGEASYAGYLSDAEPGFRADVTTEVRDTGLWHCASAAPACPEGGPSCLANGAPVLGEPVFVVNGAVRSAFQPGDHVVIRVPYVDRDANLACGTYEAHADGPEWSVDGDGPLCGNQPESSAASGVHLGMVLGVVSAGDYAFSVSVHDACGAPSNEVTGALSLR